MLYFPTTTGPPGEPAGLDTTNADPNIEGVSARDVILRWTDPLDTHGSPINSYMIHGQTNFSNEWVILEPCKFKVAISLFQIDLLLFL